MTSMMSNVSAYARSTISSARRLFRMFGPGLVTGAADDDPSGIATYSQVGAQFGYALSWTMFLTSPFMIAIQTVTARIGAVTGRGLAANLGKEMPATAHRQYAEYRRRHRGNGRRATSSRGRTDADLCHLVRDRLSRGRDP